MPLNGTQRQARVRSDPFWYSGGDVSPKIVEVVEHTGTRGFQFPAHCPECGGIVVRAEGEADHRCVNASCPAKLRESLLHFTSRGVMNIEGMGEALVNRLLETQTVKSTADIYLLDREKLLALRSAEFRIGEKIVENVLQQIEGSKQLPLERVILALRKVLERNHLWRTAATAGSIPAGVIAHPLYGIEKTRLCRLSA